MKKLVVLCVLVYSSYGFALTPSEVCGNLDKEQLTACMVHTNAAYYDESALKLCNSLAPIKKHIFITTCMKNIASKVFQDGQLEVCGRNFEKDTVFALDCLAKAGNVINSASPK